MEVAFLYFLYLWVVGHAPSFWFFIGFAIADLIRYANRKGR